MEAQAKGGGGWAFPSHRRGHRVSLCPRPPTHFFGQSPPALGFAPLPPQVLFITATVPHAQGARSCGLPRGPSTVPPPWNRPPPWLAGPAADGPKCW